MFWVKEMAYAKAGRWDEHGMFIRDIAEHKIGKGRWPEYKGCGILLGNGNPGKSFQQVEDINRFVFWQQDEAQCRRERPRLGAKLCWAVLSPWAKPEQWGGNREKRYELVESECAGWTTSKAEDAQKLPVLDMGETSTPYLCSSETVFPGQPNLITLSFSNPWPHFCCFHSTINLTLCTCLFMIYLLY